MKYDRFLLLILLLLLSSCGKKLEEQIDHQIRTLDNLDLDEETVEILSIEQSGKYAVAEVAIKTAVKMRKDDQGWVLEEVRLGEGKWEKVSRIVEALNIKRTEETVEKMEAIQAGINRYKEIRGEIPVVDDFRELIDVLTPMYMKTVIRMDAWWNAFSYRNENTNQFELRSAGPDRRFHTPDDIVSTG